MSSGFFSSVGQAKERGPGHEYLGVGSYELEILELKEKDLKFIAELKVIEARPHQGEGPETPVGAEVSWMVSCAGSQRQIEMGRADVKGFMLAVIRSAGRDPESLAPAAWDGFGAKCVGRENGARGLRIRAQLYRRRNKETGEIYRIPSARFAAVPGQPARPGLFEVFGAKSEPQKPASASGDVLAKLRAGLEAAKAKGITTEKVMDESSPGYKRAIASGVTPAQYLETVEAVFGDDPGW